MNLNISEHIAYNQYKEKLNEIYDKLDEVIYISNTIDYKKITILLAEIVQNFDYFKHHKEKLATDAKEKEDKAKVVVGGKGNEEVIPTAGVPTGVPEATPTPVKELPPPKPYSEIDDDKDFVESIKNIREGDEYKKLVSYINATKERINTKGTKLMEKVKEFLQLLETPDRNSMIDSDYIKQYSNLEFKLKDIISNIEKIEDGIQKESTEYAKIYVDLMSNKWCSIKSERFNFLAICADGWYSNIKKPFVKNAHVIEKDDGADITRNDYTDFVENKLYKLYNKLHDEFPKEPKDKKASKDSTDEKPSDKKAKATPTEDFGAINVLFKEHFDTINEKIAEEEAKAKEAEATKDEATKDEDTKDEDTKDEATNDEATNEGETKPEAKPETSPLTTTEKKAEAKAKIAEAKEKKEAEVEDKIRKAKLKAIAEATNRNVAKEEEEAILTKARIESAKTAKAIAEEKKALLESNAEELAKSADDARKKIVESRAEAKMSSLIGKQTSQFKGLANSFNKLTGEVGTETNKTKDFYANIIKNKNNLKPKQAFQEFSKI